MVIVREWLDIVLMILVSIGFGVYFTSAIIYSIYSTSLDKRKYEDEWWYKFCGVVSYIPVLIFFSPFIIGYAPMYVYKKAKQITSKEE